MREDNSQMDGSFSMPFVLHRVVSQQFQTVRLLYALFPNAVRVFVISLNLYYRIYPIRKQLCQIFQ